MSAKAERAFVKALRLFGNPSAPHAEGREARAAVEDARAAIALAFRVKADDLIFTSGGTESNTIAVLGTPKGHAITTSIEHATIREAFRLRATHGSKTTFIRPDATGRVNADDIVQALRPNTVLVSVHHVHGECGVVQRIADIADAVRRTHPSVIIHTDASQSPLWLDAGPHTLRADLVTYDAQKVGGPKGAGILYAPRGTPLSPVFGGGSQERGIRPGTENTAAIVAAGVAFTEAVAGRVDRARTTIILRDYLADRLRAAVPNARIIGSMKHRVANNVLVAIPGVDADYLTVLLDTHGIAVTPRSACLGSVSAASHVAEELTGDDDLARSTIRFSLHQGSTKAELDRAVRALITVLPLATRVRVP